jgi:hypothetical protein
MQLSNNTFLTNEALTIILEKNIIPQLQGLFDFNTEDIEYLKCYFSEKLLGKHKVTYPSFDITLTNGKKLVFKLYKERLWLHNTNFFPCPDFLNKLGMSLMNNTFYIQADIQVQLILSRHHIFNYLPKSSEYLLFTLYSYVETDETTYVFLDKETGIEMFFGYFIFSEGSILSIPKALYYQVLNSTL